MKINCDGYQFIVSRYIIKYQCYNQSLKEKLSSCKLILINRTFETDWKD